MLHVRQALVVASEGYCWCELEVVALLQVGSGKWEVKLVDQNLGLRAVKFVCNITYFSCRQSEGK